jgi:hypothetical protein
VCIGLELPKYVHGGLSTTGWSDLSADSMGASIIVEGTADDILPEMLLRRNRRDEQKKRRR